MIWYSLVVCTFRLKREKYGFKRLLDTSMIFFIYCRVLKFYKRTSGKPTIVANGVVSDLTPWPLNKSQLRQDYYRKTGFVLRVKGFD